MGDLSDKMEKYNRNYRESAHLFKNNLGNESSAYVFLSDENDGTLKESTKMNLNYTFSIQDLYDATNVKNGLNIYKAASLICESKNINIVSDESFVNVCKDFSRHLNSLGVKTFLYKFEDMLCLKGDDTLLIVTESTDDIKYRSILENVKSENLKVISVLPEKDNEDKFKSDVIVHFLNIMNFDKQLCVDVILNCIGISVLVKLKNT